MEDFVNMYAMEPTEEDAIESDIVAEVVRKYWNRVGPV